MESDRAAGEGHGVTTRKRVDNFGRNDYLEGKTQEDAMAVLTFDTLAYSKTLQDSGISREQADAMARAQVVAMKDMISAQELASKQDIQIAIKELEIRLLKWQIGIGFALAVIMAKGFGWLGF